MTCQYCGNYHGPTCPLVKAFEYHADGTLKRVEFFAPNDHQSPQPLQSALWPGLGYLVPDTPAATSG